MRIYHSKPNKIRGINVPLFLALDYVNNLSPYIYIYILSSSSFLFNIILFLKLTKKTEVLVISKLSFKK
jgi:hypothetical protein